MFKDTIGLAILSPFLTPPVLGGQHGQESDQIRFSYFFYFFFDKSSFLYYL